jgi:isocitrate lyase
VVVPIREFVQKLIAARLAADVMGVPALLIARTDADAARLLLSDVDERDEPFLTGTKTEEGFFGYTGGLEAAVARGLAYAPYADMIWCETSVPDLEQAREFASAIHNEFPGKLLAYNCSPSFHWKKNLNDRQIARFQHELADLGYKFQFVTLAGFHSLNLGMFELARDYAHSGMSAYVRLQEREFAMSADGYSAIRHQRFVGTGYFDAVQTTIAGGRAATEALEGSTEKEQFQQAV